MPSPSSSLATLRPDLAASVMEFDLANARVGFIGTQVMPLFPAAEAAGPLGRIPVEQLLQNRSIERAPGGGYSRGSFTFEPDSYVTVDRGAEEPVDDVTRKMYRNYFDAEVVCGQRAYDAVLRGQEIRVADLLFNATNFTPTAVTHEWDDATNAVPIANIEASIRRIWLRSGLWPNALIINRLVFRNLRNCAQIIDRIQSGGAGSSTKPTDINAAMLAQVFDLPKVIVAGSPKNTADEGQDISIAPIWSSEYAMVARLAETEDYAEPCLGRTFHWDEDGSDPGGTFETYREEGVRADIVRVRHQVGEKFIHTVAADLLSNITT